MKFTIFMFVVIMLFLSPIFGTQVFAHPPQDMILDFDIDTNLFNVTITHTVSNPNDHYIYKVEIRKNDELVITGNYNSQPSISTFTYTYPLENPVGGDVFEVRAFCSIAGSTTRELIIPSDNNPPFKPDINGPTSGQTNTEYEYRFVAIDPDDDGIYYCIDWGDDSGETCIGPFSSGDEQTFSHIWNQDGSYTIKAKARDINDAESEWETFQVSMPKNKLNIPFGFIFVFGSDVDVKIIQLPPGEDYVDLEVLDKPFYIWENEIITRNQGEFIRLYTAKGLFSPSLPFCFGICNDWSIIG